MQSAKNVQRLAFKLNVFLFRSLVVTSREETLLAARCLPLLQPGLLDLGYRLKEDYSPFCWASLPQIRIRVRRGLPSAEAICPWTGERSGCPSMETRLELDVLIFPDEVRVPTPEELSEWELETASQLSGPPLRLFVALYPYNPAAMSPNYDTAAEELPFVPGQIIKVRDFYFYSTKSKPKETERNLYSQRKNQLGFQSEHGATAARENTPVGEKLRADPTSKQPSSAFDQCGWEGKWKFFF